MKKTISLYLTLLLFIVASTACSDNVHGNYVPSYTLHLDSSVPMYGETTRAATGSWQNGDIIYLLFIDGETQQIECRATYNSSFHDWVIDNISSSFSHTDGICKVHYFRGGEIANGTTGSNSVSFDEHTAVFADRSASYQVIEDDIYVTARLKPQTWRIAFNGESGKSIKISSSSGIESYSSFRPSQGLGGKGIKDYHLTILSNGYTDYIHGSLSLSPCTLSVVMDNKIYCRLIDNSLLTIGQSGYFKLPTEANPFGWNYGGLNSTEISLEGFSTDRDLDNTTGGPTEQTGSQDISIDGNSEDKNLDGTTGSPTESTGTQDITIEGYGPDKILD